MSLGNVEVDSVSGEKTRCQCIPRMVEGMIHRKRAVGNAGGERQLTVAEGQVQKNAVHIVSADAGVC